jgi:hypothetical protein
MKYFKLLLIFFLLFIKIWAQANITDSLATASLNTSAKRMAQLFVDKKYDAYVNFVHPKIWKSLGGKDKMIVVLKKSLKDMEAEGFAINNVTILETAPVVIVKTELQSVVTQMLELKMKDGRLVSTSYLIATSTDNGKTWYFTDTSGKTLKQMQALFPSLSNKLVIPEKTNPLFYKD